MKVEVLVKPGSKKGPLVAPSQDAIMVYLREKPHDGEANEALIKVLAEYYGVSKSQVAIISGGKSRKKVVEIFNNM